MAEVLRPARLSGGQRAAVGMAVTMGLGLAAYGVAGSYQTVSSLAERRGVPLAWLVPVRHRWRADRRGGPGPRAVVDRAADRLAPPVRPRPDRGHGGGERCGWRAKPGICRVACRRATDAAGHGRGGPDRPAAAHRRPWRSAARPIPVARWVLAPWPTWLMWRRMVLWQTGSFPDRCGGRAGAAARGRAPAGPVWVAMEASRAARAGVDAGIRLVHSRGCWPRPRARRGGNGQRTCRCRHGR